MTTPSIDQALQDQHLLGAALNDRGTRKTWFAVLRAAFGLPLDDEQLKLFKAVAGDRDPPTKRVRELWAKVGRRGDKSEMAGAIVDYLAIFVKHKLSNGLVLCLSMSLEQSRVVFDYALSFLQSSEILKKEIKSVTQNEIRLKNGITIAMHANNYRSIRGRTLCACVFDECAFWRDDSTATPDTETYSAVLPSLLTTNGMLISISSAYRRAGLMYNKSRDYFGQNDPDTLVVQGPTTIFNPTVDADRLAAMKAADPVAAASEWDSIERDDLAGFIDDHIAEGAVNEYRPLELAPAPHGIFYRAWTDPSGGAISGDAYSLAIGHREGDKVIIDLVRGITGPFDPKTVTEEFAAICKKYRINTITGDAYSKEWCASAWRACGISYVQSELPASQLYLEMLPMFYRGLVELPNDKILIRELKLLERRAGLSGKEAVGHPRGQHDDRINCVAGVIRTLSDYLGFNVHDPFGLGPDQDDPAVIKQNEKERQAAEARAFEVQNYFNHVNRCLATGAAGGYAYGGRSNNYNVFADPCYHDPRTPVPSPPPEIAGNFPSSPPLKR